VALYTSEGDVAARTPARLTAGAATGLDMPVAAARDAAGNIYVANAHGNSITEYAPTANGNAAPVRTWPTARTTPSPSTARARSAT
jgi:hypothetical protein